MLQKSYYLSDTVKRQVQPLINTNPQIWKTSYNTTPEQKKASKHAIFRSYMLINLHMNIENISNRQK